MNTVNLLIVNAFSFVICLAMLLDVNIGFEKKFRSNIVFKLLLLANIAITLFDSLCQVFGGNPEPYAKFLLEGAYYILYLLIPVPCYLWIQFVNYQLFHDRRNTGKLQTTFILPYAVYVLFLALNPFLHELFAIDAANVYHRGALFGALPAVCCFYAAFSYLMLVKYGRRLNRRNITPLFLFAAPAAACGLLQSLFYGLPLLPAGLSVSMLILYMTLQNRRIYTDYLTGLFNRREADSYLRHKIRTQNGPAFSAVMIDVDKFKEINDKYGHLVGDEALENVAAILKKSLRADDFIARYGGDEFLVIFDIDEQDILRKAVRRVRNAVIDFNAKSQKPYTLSLSMGYTVYNRFSGWDADNFLKHIDSLMYEDKARRSEGQVYFLDQSMTI